MSEVDESGFPARLRKTRKARGLDQSVLGEQARIPATSISLFESGKRKPSLDNLKRLADELAVSIDYLLCRTDNPDAHLDAAAFRHKDLTLKGELEEMKKIMARVNATLNPGVDDSK